MLIEQLKSVWSDAELVSPQSGDAWLAVPREKMANVCRALFSEQKFHCLSSLTGVDRGEYFEVVYHLFSYDTKETLVLKTRVEKANPTTRSVCDIWPSANWFEREVFDLLGIIFEGHPNLKRIMLPDDWVGHPLRKDYQEESEYHGMTTIR